MHGGAVVHGCVDGDCDYTNGGRRDGSVGMVLLMGVVVALAMVVMMLVVVPLLLLLLRVMMR